MHQTRHSVNDRRRLSAVSSRPAVLSATTMLRRISSAVTTFDVPVVTAATVPIGIRVKSTEHGIDPNSSLISHWHQLLLAAVCYELFAIPFLFTFKPHPTLGYTPEAVLVYGCETLFLIDFFVKFNTILIKDGCTLSLAASRLVYLRSREFVVDVIAIVPLSLFPVRLPGSRMVLEVTKVIRISRFPGYLANLDNLYAKHFEQLKLFKILIGVNLLSHWLACVRFLFGYHSTDTDPYHQDHWLPEHSNNDHSCLAHYLRALFWSFGILTGLYEGELPSTSAQFVFTIFVALCGFAMFTYLCATFFMLSKCESSQSEATEARINQLKQVLAFHHVAPALRHKIVEYLRYYYADVGSSNRQITEILCQSIGRDIQVELVKDVFTRVPIFATCSEQFFVALARLLERTSLPAQCTLFSVGEQGDAMYIIRSGVLDVMSSSNRKLRELRKNDFVGEISLFSNQPRSATVITATFCVLYKLSKRHAEIVLKGYPGVATNIKNCVQRLLVAIPGQNKGNEGGSQSGANPRRSSLFSTSIRQLIRQGSSLRGSFFRRSGSTSTIIPAPHKTSTESVRMTRDETLVRHDCVSSSQHIHDSHGGKRKFSDTMRTFYMEYLKVSQNSKRPWWAKLLLKSCIDADSARRMWWITCLQMVLIYNWYQIPLNLAFPLFIHSAWYIMLLNILADVILWVDIYINFNLSYTQSSEKVWEPTRSAPQYLRTKFLFDLLTVFPFPSYSDSSMTYVSRIPRLLRIWRSIDYYHEVDKLRRLKSKQRLFVYGILLVLLSHILACLYFSITFIEGFNSEEDSWLPSDDVELHKLTNGQYVDVNNVTYDSNDPEVQRIAYEQYFRSLYYATNVLTALGRTIEPASSIQFGTALLFMFSGFFITAIVVDNVQKRFTASAYEEKEFFAMRSRIQLFLRRQSAPFEIHQRANNFLDFWWESHRGARIADLLSDLPTEYRREVLFQICKPALQTLPLLNGIRSCLEAVEVLLVDNAEFILYGHGEIIYGQGEHSHGLYFLLSGDVRLRAPGTHDRVVIRGGCFGTRSFYTDGNATGYEETAIAESGCTVLFLPQCKFEKLKAVFPSLGTALIHLEKRLFDSKLSAKRKSTARKRRSVDPASTISRILWSPIDPDSKFVILWETYLFFLMSAQYFRVITLICFGITSEAKTSADVITVTIEMFFLLDIFVRLRLGYRHFGNKILDHKRIRRRYLRSWHFFVDLAALLPLFIINWIYPATRMEIVNINKLIRLVKVPSQVRSLQTRYVKFTNELRLFKLVYYTAIASHLLGSLYFDFASHASAVYSLASGTGHKTNFGANKWLPPASLENATRAEQYFASQFWSFGLMSASTQAELPKTSVQCMFTIVTLTTGFFLFAYVVGNLSDVIELGDAENREINEKLGWTRRLLHHFSLSPPVAAKLKTYFLFKRFHSITQEHILAQSLPPSLMTDIRLLNLRAMIERVPFLGSMDSSITRMLVSQFTQLLIMKDEFVFHLGDPGNDMFFVFSGSLQSLVPFSNIRAGPPLARWHSKTWQAESLRNLAIIGDIVAGDFFGENGLLSDSPRLAYIRAKTSCILYSLSKNSLEMVFELYPDWRKSVEQIAKIQHKQHRHASSVGRQPREDVSPHFDIGTPISRGHIPVTYPSFWHKFSRFAYYRLELQSKEYLLWVRIVYITTITIAVTTPFCVAFESCGNWSGVSAVVDAIEVCCFTVFLSDIWIQLGLRQTDRSVEFYEGDVRSVYKRHRLIWDILAVLPLEYIAEFGTQRTAKVGWLRFNRCFKIANLVHYMNERRRTSVSFERARMKVVCSCYVLIIHWVACGYLLFAEKTGYGEEWNAWLPSHEIDLTHKTASVLVLRYLRGLYFAVTAFVKKCRTFTPESMEANIFAIVTWFVGLLVMAFVIGEIASLYISFIRHEVIFRKYYIAAELSLADWKLSSSLKARVHAFLSNLWASHRGLNYKLILDELPKNLRQETVIEIGGASLKNFKASFLQPAALNSSASLAAVFHSLVDKLHFESYPPGELVLTEGTISTGMFFVVKGQLAGYIRRGRKAVSLPPLTQGSYFGELGLLSYSLSLMTIQATQASDLLSLDLDDLQSVLQLLPGYSAIERIVKQVARELREQSSIGALPTQRETWGNKIHDTLFAERSRLALSFKGSGTETDGESEWFTFLVSILDSEHPTDLCLHILEPFIKLLLPQSDLVWDDALNAPSPRKKSEVRSEHRLSFSKNRASSQLHALGRSNRVASMIQYAKVKPVIKFSLARKAPHNPSAPTKELTSEEPTTVVPVSPNVKPATSEELFTRTSPRG